VAQELSRMYVGSVRRSAVRFLRTCFLLNARYKIAGYSGPFLMRLPEHGEARTRANRWMKWVSVALRS